MPQLHERSPSRSAPHRRLLVRGLAAIAGAALTVGPLAEGSGPLEGSPAYERYREVARSAGRFGRSGTISGVRWSADGRHLSFSRGEGRLRLDLRTRELRQVQDSASTDDEESGPAADRRSSRPARGRQRDRESSPDGRWTAVCRDYNVVLEDPDGEVIELLSTEGQRKHRFGTASWVYGEELDQRSAMWWSPDSGHLAYYEFDERQVSDFPLIEDLAERRPRTRAEGYPKPGEPNPVARLHLYELATRQSVQIDTGPSGDDDIGHYVFNVRFTPDGRSLLFSRTSRRQNVLEVVAAEVETGRTKVVVRETQETWQRNRPVMRFLADGSRFIWETERTGYRQYELRALDGGRIATLTDGPYPVDRIVHVDEARGLLYYTAFSDTNPLNAQLHRAGLDGRGQVRLTWAPMHHTVSASPDGRWFVARTQSLTTPPSTVLLDLDGRRIATLAEGDPEEVTRAGLTPAELFTFRADDGLTDLYGILYKPSDFDPDRTYPLLLHVYGGPQRQRVRNLYRPARAECELGYLIAEIDNRGTPGRGKAFESATYLGLGSVDLKDQVDGVRHLCRRRYVDGRRVGVHGHSYGGYLAALAILKYPDVFAVAVAGAPVTDWRNYDSIYTERYMRTPEENPSGYDQGSCLTFAGDLSGSLLLVHGMEDDNVHAANSWQLVERLQAAGKRFDMHFFPERGHSLGQAGRMLRLEYFHEHLVASPRPGMGKGLKD